MMLNRIYIDKIFRENIDKFLLYLLIIEGIFDDLIYLIKKI